VFKVIGTPELEICSAFFANCSAAINIVLGYDTDFSDMKVGRHMAPVREYKGDLFE
jgi:hypothetical protein